MSWIEATIILFGGLCAIMALGLPVAIAFLAINLVGAWIFLGGESGLIQFNRNAVQSVTSFALTPIPFFVLMGEVLFHSGVAMKAIDAFALLIRRVPGRLSVIAIVAGTVFSAISGSTIATTALLGSLAGISISGLLIGGIVPGLMLSALFIGYIILRSVMNPDLAPADTIEATPSAWERWGPFLIYVLPLLLIFGLVVGAMSAGWATPTEAAALGATGTIIAAIAYRGLTIDNLMKSLLGTVAISGTILFIIVGATTFSQVLSFSGVVNGIIGLITGQGLSTMTVLIGMILILLFLGCFVDQVSMMLITLPFFMPLVIKLGIDPIWFGIIFLICMQLGLLTPPFGLLLYTMKGVAPKSITMNQVYMAATPYVLFGLLVLVAIVMFPPLATWLPGLLN
jgi:TRAP-type C4-dicarboxylate transport system permease large subunit